MVTMTDNPPDTSLLKPEQVAKRLNTTERKVLDLLRDGELIGIKVRREWRIEPSEVEDFIRRNKQG